MTTVYKLTDRDLRTFAGYKYVPGRWQTTSGDGNLCGPGWLHAYETLSLAAFHWRAHVYFPGMRCWRAEYKGKLKRDGGLKCGVSELRLIEEIALPEPTPEQCIAYAILCAMETCDNADWHLWADRWLAGDDRSEEAAEAARLVAWTAVITAECAATEAAEGAADEWAANEWGPEATRLAERAADLDAEIAEGAAKIAREAAEAAVWTARAAKFSAEFPAEAAQAAAWAAEAATRANPDIDLAAIAQEAMKY